MEAARDEFAERGFAGGRMESIAKRAGIAKPLLYHYFANKEALFEATFRSKYEQHKPPRTAVEGPGELFVHRFAAAIADPVWIRFLSWEAAEHRDAGEIIAEAPRREAIARGAAAVVRAQKADDLPADMPPELLQLAIYALGLFPVAFPQTTEMIAGQGPEDGDFQARWMAFLDDLAQRLARP